jgi:PAS domain-containing protein
MVAALSTPTPGRVMLVPLKGARVTQPCDIVQELERLFAESPDLIFVFAPDHRYLLANRTAAAEFDLTPADFVGAHWKDLELSEDVMLPFTEKIDDVVADNKPLSVTVEGSPERGSKVYQTSLTPVCCEDGVVFGVLVIARDVTALVH